MIAHMQVPTKVVVTVAEMARMVGLSRARFYQLQGTTFPWPVYDIATRRPLYVEEQQLVCLEVRRRNCGIDGKPILFYARRQVDSVPLRKVRSPTPAPKQNQHAAEVIEGLKSLGLTSVTAAQVYAAVEELFPKGTAGIALVEVIRAVFVHLKRRD
jgi:hypothetical protein